MGIFWAGGILTALLAQKVPAVNVKSRVYKIMAENKG